MKRIYRPREGRVLVGVCAGVGEFFSIDPVWFGWGGLFSAAWAAAVFWPIWWLLC